MADFIHIVVTEILQLAEASLVALIVAIATQLLRKLNLTLTAQQEARLRYYAERATLAVEETAVAKGGAKLQAAKELVVQQLPGVPLAAVVDAIHAELARQRADVGNQLFAPKPDAAPR